ncbi:hypothetical protein LTR49_024718, partial [Elasticomyces elasticus]
MAADSPSASIRVSVPYREPGAYNSYQPVSGYVVKKPNDSVAYKSIAHKHGGDNSGVTLRNSCGCCAGSKVKRDKGKPTCSRCQSRNLDCAYLQSKRPGRVPGKVQSSQASEHFRFGYTQGTQAKIPIFAPTSFPSLVELGDRAYGAEFDWQRTDSGLSMPFTGDVPVNVFGTPPIVDINSDFFYAGNAPPAPMRSSNGTPTSGAWWASG